MVDPILHIVIPLLILFAFDKQVDKKLVFGLAFLTLLPDADFLIPWGHRNLFHTFWFVLVMSTLVYLFFRTIMKKKEWENKNAFYLSLYYLFSHLFLDLKIPGIPFFSPLYKESIGIPYQLYITPYKDIILAPPPELRFYLLSIPSFLILVLIVILYFTKKIKKH